MVPLVVMIAVLAAGAAAACWRAGGGLRLAGMVLAAQCALAAGLSGFAPTAGAGLRAASVPGELAVLAALALAMAQSRGLRRCLAAAAMAMMLTGLAAHLVRHLAAEGLAVMSVPVFLLTLDMASALAALALIGAGLAGRPPAGGSIPDRREGA